MTEMLAPRKRPSGPASPAERTRPEVHLRPVGSPPDGVATTRRRRGARWILARVALLAFATGIALLLAGAALEIYLRGPGAARFPALGMLYDCYETAGPGQIRIAPNYAGSITVEGRTLRVETNERGMRGPAVAPRRPGERRVLVLGDSFAFGHGVEAEEAFSALLEQQLDGANGNAPVRVFNAGVPGAGHEDQLITLRRHLDLEPDVIVSCLFTGNDFDGDFFGPKEVRSGYWFGSGATRLLDHNLRARIALRSRAALVIDQWIDKHVPALGQDRSMMLPTPGELASAARFQRPRNEGLFMDERSPTPVVAEVLDRIEHTMARISRMAPKARRLVVIIPSLVQVWPGVYPAALQRDRLPVDAFERGLGAERVRAHLEAAGVRTLDLTRPIGDHADPASLYLPSDFHLTVQGHKVVAAAVQPHLAALLAGDPADAPEGGPR